MRLVTTRFVCALALGFMVSSGAALAQVTAEQQSAMRANCRSDAMSKCSGMRGQEALACLQKNVSSLSPACKAVVSTTLPKPAVAAPPPAAPAPAKPAAPPPAAASTPPPAPAAPPAPAQATVAPPAPSAAPAVTAPPPPAPPKAAASTPAAKPAAKPVVSAKPPAPALTAAQQNAMKSACRSDFMSRCSGVAPGGKEALTCLQTNVAVLSPGCKSVISSTMAAPAAPPAAAAPQPASAPPAADAAAGPTPQQMNALKFTCGRDFSRLCKGVPAGGSEAFNCLQSNAARLSPNCKTSLADIADSLPAGAMPAPPAAPVAKSPETGGPVDAVVMVRACKLDLIRHCRDVELGEHRKIECLTAHMPKLTARCRTALKVTSPLR